MSYGGAPRGAGTYGGARDVAGARGGGVITDPARPEGSGWRWSTSKTALGPYGGLSYGGGGGLGYPSAGGLSATPDPLLGTVRVAAWWSSAPYLRLARVVDGVRTPVRGAYPLAVTAPTRFNRCTNPSAEVDLTGWLAGSNTTLSRITEAAMPDGTSAFRLRATAAGTVAATVPVALPLAEGAPQVSLNLRAGAAPSGALTVSVTWLDQTGASMGTTSATVPAATLAGFVGRWDRTAVLSIPQPFDSTGAKVVTSGTMTFSVAGLAASGVIDIDAVLIEGGSSDGSYFDGARQYGAWMGTPHASSSALAPVVDVVDREAPLDRPVQYELTAPNQPAYVLTSEPIVLDSRDRTFLGHPVLPYLIVATVTREPKVTRTIERGVHKVIGRRRPIAISASTRDSESGTLEVLVTTFAERDRLWEMLDDGQPLLLRAPARLGHGPGEWLSIADVDLDPPGHGAWEGARLFSLPYQVVDGPVANPDDPTAAAAA
ncbi:hypothetical protein [Pseudonocardia sp. WMMC193]|uniref:hypothetical protein n=1 Tax=Pseudonocardia sp. WMMC193 TaxID=2911965 RepID=UPI001F244E59|nr:hypothetical protein [Pseudonocardia sp. WMMC193]MCF7550965.1 hypothetical protein [Pseudonocardia sp. WMMC193]